MPAEMPQMDASREKGFQDYRKKLMEHKEVESKLKDSKFCVTTVDSAESSYEIFT